MQDWQSSRYKTATFHDGTHLDEGLMHEYLNYFIP